MGFIPSLRGPILGMLVPRLDIIALGALFSQGPIGIGANLEVVPLPFENPVCAPARPHNESGARGRRMTKYMATPRSVIKPLKVGQLSCLENGDMIAFYMIERPKLSSIIGISVK